MLDLIIALLLAILPPCASDDGSPGNCGWDADVQGNGTGRSFVVLEMPWSASSPGTDGTGR